MEFTYLSMRQTNAQRLQVKMDTQRQGLDDVRGWGVVLHCRPDRGADAKSSHQ